MTLTENTDSRHLQLYGDKPGGGGRMSFNLNRLTVGRVVLHPREMPATAVIAFVAG